MKAWADASMSTESAVRRDREVPTTGGSPPCRTRQRPFLNSSSISLSSGSIRVSISSR